MAKLNPKDPQFGIPIASRIDSNIATRLNSEAGKAGMTFSRYVAVFIEKAVANESKITEIVSLLSKEKQTILHKEKQITELQAGLAKEKITAKNTAARFIIEITSGEKTEITRLAQTYNNILTNERRKNL